jgi:hypothetical protein
MAEWPSRSRFSFLRPLWLAQFKPEQAIQSRSPKLDSRRFRSGSAFAGLGAMGLLGWRRKRRAALAA